MDNCNYYIGNLAGNLNGPARGWIAGDFDTVCGPRRTSQVEIKYWKFDKENPPKHKTKVQFRAVEITFILQGQIEGHVGNDKVVLSEGQFIVIIPKTANNLVEKVNKTSVGVTVKAPSDPEDKIELD